MNLFIPLMLTPGPMEIMLLVLVVVLLFGGRKIPELMKGLGQGMKEFKKATKEEVKKNDKKEEKEKIDS